MRREIAGPHHPGGIVLDLEDERAIDELVSDRAADLASKAALGLDRAAYELAEYSADPCGLVHNIAILVGDLRKSGDLPAFVERFEALMRNLADQRAESERDGIEAAYIREHS